jgi:hypothetical protein
MAVVITEIKLRRMDEGTENIYIVDLPRYRFVIVTWWLKARIVEREERSIARLQQPKQPPAARQWLCKHVCAATEADATVEELL